MSTFRISTVPLLIKRVTGSRSFTISPLCQTEVSGYRKSKMVGREGLGKGPESDR